MAGSTRFELASGNSEGSAFPTTYSNGQRGNYANASMDRSGSFKEGVEGRLLGPGSCSSRGSTPSSGEVPNLSMLLSLDPITMGDQKFTRSGELRRVLGVSLGSTSEDHFGASHSKAPPIASEELKRFKASLLDTSSKARDRVKKLTDSVFKLDKFRHTLISRKRRTESSERSGAGGMLKMGSQIHQNPPDSVPQKMEERTKSVLNRRVRTSIADSEGRATPQLRPPAAVDKEREMFRAVSGPAQGEEKIRGLPAGGEGWDNNKMKRKRSVGALSARADADRELKRTMVSKVSNDPRSRSSDTHSFGSGSSSGIAGTNKLDGATQPANANLRHVRNELENNSLANDRRERGGGHDRERAVKGNKFGVREDILVGSSAPIIRGKASRTPRIGTSGVHSSPTFLRGPGAVDGWEQPQGQNKVPAATGPNNRKRPLPAGSAVSPMGQWGGPKPQTRPRKSNVVSPVPNHDEAQISSEGPTSADVGGRVTCNEANGSLLPRGVPNNTQQLKLKLENVQSPARLSESEESGAGEKGVGTDDIGEKAVPKVGTFLSPTKKNRRIMNEEIGDGVRRQGRTGRGSSLSRGGVPPLREKMENPSIVKAAQSSRLVSDKNESKSGRPPKKLSERKAFTRAVHVSNGSSPDFTGESDDDREELLAAATSVHTSKQIACTGPFWKKTEPVFASLDQDNTAYIKEHLFFAETIEKSLHHADPVYNLQSQGELVTGEQLGVDTSSDKSESDMENDTDNPLYQRLLSAIITEDEMEDLDDNIESNNLPLAYASDYSPSGTNGDRVVSEVESEMEFRPQRAYLLDSFSRDGSIVSNGFKSPSSRNASSNDDMWQGDNSAVHSEFGAIPGNGPSNLDGSQPMHVNVNGISSSECEYGQMPLDKKVLVELNSIGIYPNTAPDVAEERGEGIDGCVAAAKTDLYQEVVQEKRLLLHLVQAIQKEMGIEEQDLEQEAMDKLVEMAYKKLMAIRGSSASKNGGFRLSKQAALSFLKRTLGRCKKFEETGKSCFSDPALRDIILSGSANRNDSRSVRTIGGVATHAQTPASKQESRAPGAITTMIGRHGLNGDKLDTFSSPTHSSDQAFPKHEPISNRGRKREVLLDDVNGSPASRSSSLGNNLVGGPKGRRSERDRDQVKNMLGTNSVPKAGRPAVGSCRGERKTKTKPKQKIAQLPTSGNGLLGRVTETTCPVYPPMRVSNEVVTNGSSQMIGEQGLSRGNLPRDSSKETEESIGFSNLPMHEIDSIDELGVAANLDASQDLSSWLDFNEEGLLDHDSMGLEIPMDDLSDLNMIV